MSGVTLKSIYKNFDKTEVLRDVSLKIRDKEFISLVGPSGCGKSTLLKIIAGLEEQTAGEVYISNNRVDKVSPKNRDIAMVFQSYALYPHLTVYKNMAVPLMLRSLKWYQRFPVIGKFFNNGFKKYNDINATIENTAKMLHIEELLSRKPGQLSGGQRQRVALGRAMVRHPKVFLMDEPLSNLDAKLRVQMRAEIAQLHQKLQTTFIYVTHDQTEAMTMSDRVAIMMDGKLLQVGTPQEVYRNPLYQRVAEFIGTPKINILPCERINRSTIDSLGYSFSLNLDSDTSKLLILGVRPEALKLTPSGSGWHGKVVHKEFLGSYLLFYVQLNFMENPIIILSDEESPFNPDINTYVSVQTKTSKIYLFDSLGNRIHTNKENSDFFYSKELAKEFS